MGRKQKFIEKLSLEEQTTLQEGYKNSTRSDFRKRCQVVLLSHKRLTTIEIVRVTDLSKLTVYKVLAKWRQDGISGLIRQKGQGRKPRLDVNNAQHVTFIEKQIEQNAQKIEEHIPSIIEHLQVSPFSKWTLKRFLKNLTTAGKDSDED